MGMNLSKLQKIVENREAWCVAVHGVCNKNNTKIIKTQLKYSSWKILLFLIVIFG